MVIGIAETYDVAMTGAAVPIISSLKLSLDTSVLYFLEHFLQAFHFRVSIPFL